MLFKLAGNIFIATKFRPHQIKRLTLFTKRKTQKKIEPIHNLTYSMNFISSVAFKTELLKD